MSAAISSPCCQGAGHLAAAAALAATTAPGPTGCSTAHSVPESRSQGVIAKVCNRGRPGWIEAWRTVVGAQGQHGSQPPCKHFALHRWGAPSELWPLNRH